MLVLAAGCGSGQPTEDAFIHAANLACMRFQHTVKGSTATAGQAEVLRLAVRARASELATLKSLRPPKNESGTLQRLINISDMVNLVESKLSRKPLSSALLTRAIAFNDEQHLLAASIGLQKCATSM